MRARLIFTVTLLAAIVVGWAIGVYVKPPRSYYLGGLVGSTIGFIGFYWENH